MMTESRAIEVVGYIKTFDGMDFGATKIALEMAIKALEKQIAKKPVDKIMYLECPACGDVGILDCEYCPVCGQKLDWEGEWKWKD